MNMTPCEWLLIITIHFFISSITYGCFVIHLLLSVRSSFSTNAHLCLQFDKILLVHDSFFHLYKAGEWEETRVGTQGVLGRPAEIKHTLGATRWHLEAQFLNVIFKTAGVFLWWCLIYQFFSLMVVVFMFYLRNLCLFQGHEDFLLWLFLEFYSLTIMFRSVIHLELIFVSGMR